jgi:lysine 6-dehydrogenase
MRVVALGAGGATGAVAASTAAAQPTVTELIIADRHVESADRVKESLLESGAPAAVSTAPIDITDDAALRALLADADAVINTVGPFLTFGPSTLRAAITTGTHYLDTCDDPEPIDVLLAMHAEAADAGVTAVIGVGASPGLSNLLAVLAAARVDQVHDVYTAWGVDVGDAAGDTISLVGAQGRPTAAALHWMHQISGNVAVVSAGTLIDAKPLQAVPLRLPGQLAGTAYVVGHPEPLTFRDTLRPNGDSACLMVISSDTVAFLDVIRTGIDAGTMTIEEAAVRLNNPPAADMMRAALRSRRFPGPGNLPTFFAAVTGSRAGQRVSVLATTELQKHGMALATGLPLGLGLAQVLDGTVSGTGVYPCEAVIDATRMFADLDAHLGGSGDLLPIITEEVLG